MLIITIPRFLSAGFMVMVDLFFIRLFKAQFCFKDKFFSIVLQMFGKLSTTSYFVASIYFSRGAMPVYRSCGDSMFGAGKNLIALCT